MLKVLPIIGGVVLLFLLIIVAIILSGSNRKKRETDSPNPIDNNRSKEAMPHEKTISLKNQNQVTQPQENQPIKIEEVTEFGKVPRFDSEQKKEIAAMVQASKGLETQLLRNDMNKAEREDSGPLPAEKEADYYAVLQYKEGGLDKEFKMVSEKVSVGRDAERPNFALPYDSYVGRNHATICFDQGKFYVEDLDSKNGTFVNGVRVTGKSEIDNNCTIRFANTDVVFKINI